MNEKPSFFSELKRRNVYKVAVAYAVVGWLLIQVAATTFPILEIPNLAIKLVIAVVALGFPIALVIAWAFEMTPEGMKRTADVSPGEKIPQWSRQKFAALIVTVGLIAAGLLTFQLIRNRSLGSSAPVVAPAADELRSVAVLPFVNMSGDTANDYFSDGITEEILNAISHLPRLRVASRTSAFAYKGKNEDIAAIARNLRVTNILEGSVQRMGEQIRITAQLIDAKSGFHIWSNKFDRSAKDLFAVEDEIAQAIAQALKLEIGGEAKHSVESSGTQNVDSHDVYLKALKARNEPNLEQALKLVDQAIALDPKFAAAYALKAIIFSGLAFASPFAASYDQYIIQGETAAKRAVELDPNLGDAYIALGEMARRRNDSEIALQNFERATKLKPADPDAWQSLGLAVSSLDPTAALRYLRKAEELGSTNLYLARQKSYALAGLGELEDAHKLLADFQVSHPDFVPTYFDLGRFEMWVRGRPDRALEFFVQAYRKAPTFVDGGTPITFFPAAIYAMSDRMPEAAAWLARESATAADSSAVIATQLLMAATTGDRTQLSILRARPTPPPITSIRLQDSFMVADAALLTGDFELAAKTYQDALKGSAPQKRIPYTWVRTRLKWAYALRKLGRETEATALLEGAEATFANAPRFSFINWGIYPSQGIFYLDAELSAFRGEKEKAVAALNQMLALPDDGFIPIGALPLPIENSPLLESLNGAPGFDAFQKEAARRRVIMKQRVQAVSEKLDAVPK